ncbi:MAG: mechanosensitive ion channel family protein [Oscillospiraceae bacterium]|nr:mechanosensitive ion channel family protein [Oscillospiraceae bacterium]
MKKSNSLVKTIVRAVLLVVLLNPGMNPLLNEGAKNAATAELQKTFGMLAGGTTGAFSPARLMTALAVVILMWMLTSVSCAVLEKVSKGKKRSETVASLTISVIKVVGSIATIVWVLSVMGVDIGTIFASLGIMSLIIGFGVQSLIEDCVTGLFIIFEGLYNIGDIIVLDTFRGTVEKITLRTTTIKDTGGNLQVINNSDIRNVQNRSAIESLAVCDIGITYEADIREVEAIVLPEMERLYAENQDVFLEAPKYAGVQTLDASSVVLRFTVKTLEANYFPATRRLNREMKCLFDDKGIEIPFNQIVVHQAK